MSKLTVNTNDLQDEGLDTETVDLGTSDMTTATTDLGSSNLEVGIGGQSITVDDHLSRTSENPVQNKVVTLALDEKVAESSALTNLEIEELLK